MRTIILLLLILSSSAYGQRIYRTDETIKNGDSLEILYSNESLFKIGTDTLPLYTDYEDGGWRNMKLVRYFYDSANTLKKVSFFNGIEEQYYFYFEGTYLRKVRKLKRGGHINLQYYFTSKDNWLIASEIDPIPTQDPDRKDFYELLLMGKAFFDKFKTLL